MDKIEVRVRNAPSPTGLLHIGGIRTFLYNFLFARKNNGKYILRIEDTDQERLVPGSLENIVQSLHELGINTDEGPYWDNGLKSRGDKGPYIQSQRLDIYKKYAQELLDKKAAYYCFCTKERLVQLRQEQQVNKLPPKYDKFCLKFSEAEVAQKIKNGESHVIRLNVHPDHLIEFIDLVYGPIKISSNEVDDQVLLKSDGFPTYHLAVVVDDHLMEITHVIRSNEWIPSTPKHILLYQAFGWKLPTFVHLPPILSKTTGKKLSKREGDVSVQDFLEKGYLPEALINFLAFQGWNPKTEQEIFSMLELVQVFSLDKVNRSGAIFDLDKLDWFNSMYIRRLKIEELFARCLPYLIKTGIETGKYPKEFIEKILELERGRLRKLSEIGERVEYFFKEPTYDPQLLIWKKTEKQTIIKNLESLQTFLQTLPAKKFKRDILESETKKFIESEKLKTGEVLWPLRVALTGLEASPGPYEIMDAFSVLPDGKEQIIKRVSKAAEILFK
ncbi:MAG: glutamate--tRNA ligase [Candidatus Doudnabacteria bacterium]